MSTLYSQPCSTPLGSVSLAATAEGIYDIHFADEESVQAKSASLDDCARQLEEYFKKGRREFTSLPLALMGSEFQLAVWNAAMDIPYGEIRTYQDIAEAINRPKAMRAVGSALAANPLLVVVPCHRIVPSNGDRLQCGQFAAGSWRKAWLLNHEGQS